jgi:hypothetical protein
MRLPTRSFAVLALGLSAAGIAVAAVDPSKLPLGDAKYRTSPKAGWVDSCQTNFTGGQGAQANGPWVGKTSWDSTRKISVEGSVHWDSTFSVKILGSRRVLSGNGLPSSPTGVFPIGSSDPAYNYDRNPNSIKPYTLRVSLPANPKVAALPTCVGGTIGVSTLGVPFFSAFDDSAATPRPTSCRTPAAAIHRSRASTTSTACPPAGRTRRSRRRRT